MKKRLRKSWSKIGMLPLAVRTRINIKLRDGWRYRTIVQWLFAQKAKDEIPDLNLKAGQPFSLVWMRASKTPQCAEDNCKQGLVWWFDTHYREWLREEVSQDKPIRVLKEMQELSSVASEEARPEAVLGGNILIQSMLLETIKILHEEDTDPKEIARLATAWARLNQSATENEKVKIRTQDSVDAGLEALKSEITKNPQTVALFKKLHDAVKGPAEPKS